MGCKLEESMNAYEACSKCDQSLIVLDYLIKHGSEQSIREMRYHIVDLQTLTSFQYMDENYQDQGQSGAFH